MSEERYSENASQVPAGPSENMSAARSQIGTELTQACSPAVRAKITVLRGKVRRLPLSVKQQQIALLRDQLLNGVPAPYLARQVEIMAG